MTRLKKFYIDRVGAAGTVSLLQVLVFTLLVLAIHYFLLPSLTPAIPVVMAGGIISLQPNFLRGKKAVKMVLLQFGAGCLLAFLMTLLLPGTAVFYLLALLVGFVAATALSIKPFPVTAFIPLNIVYFMGEGTAPSPTSAAVIFIEIAAGALLALLVERVVQLPLKRSLLAMYRKYILLLEAREKKYTAEEQTATNNQLFALLEGIGFLQTGYITRRGAGRRQQALLADTYDAATRLYFTVQVMRDAPVAEHRADLFGRQYVEFRKRLQQWEAVAYE